MNREEAITVLKKVVNPKVKEAIETLIPELRESEDERIRKELIEALKTSKTVGELKFILPEPTREECIAYLEKQKEQKPNFDTHWENGSMVCEQKEQKPRLIGEDSVEKMARQMYETGQTIEEQKPEERFEEAREKYQVEWSEEDENMFNDILLDMADRREMFKSKGETIFAENTQKKIDWLDSHHIQLKYQSSCLQPKQEWSDEDKEIIANATKQLYSYADSYHNASNYTREKEVRKVAYELKSLSPSWKPSEHQMNILKAVKEYVGRGSGYWGEGLGSLIEDLEKLM